MTMHSDPTLVLRGIHQPSAPSWWPPAPGWWVIAVLVLTACAVAGWYVWRRRQRERALTRLFDASVDDGSSPSAQIAAMSELLRRAARQRDPGADKLSGDAWLEFLDRGLKSPVFAAGAGHLLRDGPYRTDVSAVEADALRHVARDRFLQWMDVR